MAADRRDAEVEAVARTKVDAVIASLLSGASVRVTTATREFEGRVWEVGRSPYDDSVRARIADRDGRVHYFRVDRADASVFTEEARSPQGEVPDPATWLRGDEAERVRIEAERDEIPPEDALAHAWEQLYGAARFPQGEDHEAAVRVQVIGSVHDWLVAHFPDAVEPFKAWAVGVSPQDEDHEETS